MDNFIEILRETWNEGIRGFGIGEIIICLAIIVVSLLVRHMIISPIPNPLMPSFQVSLKISIKLSIFNPLLQFLYSLYFYNFP
jgi:hypothetical protein